MAGKDEDDDGALFREAMRGVRRLNSPPAPAARPPRPVARRVRRDAGFEPNAGDGADHPPLAPPTPLPAVERGEVLEYRAAGAGGNVLRSLRRGRYPVEASLDLHGLTTLRAARTLREFLAEAVEHGVRCVRIVHGKGLGSGTRGPVLKNLVNHALREEAQVVAFVSAPEHDGGTGAVYVLLRRPGRR